MYNGTNIYKFTTAASWIQFTTIELLISCFIVLYPPLNNNNPVQAIIMLLSALKRRKWAEQFAVAFLFWIKGDACEQGTCTIIGKIASVLSLCLA